MRIIYNESTVKLKDLMTVEPISAEVHAAVMRSKVEARRQAEDMKEAAKQRREDSL